MGVTQIPTPAHPFVDHQARITVPWFLFLQAIYRTVGQGGYAPGDGTYIITTPDGDLPNARLATDSETVTVDLTVPGVIRWHALGGSGYAPVTTGEEPLVFVSDGMGQVVMVPYP